MHSTSDRNRWAMAAVRPVSPYEQRRSLRTLTRPKMMKCSMRLRDRVQDDDGFVRRSLLSWRWHWKVSKMLRLSDSSL